MDWLNEIPCLAEGFVCMIHVRGLHWGWLPHRIRTSVLEWDQQAALALQETPVKLQEFSNITLNTLPPKADRDSCGPQLHAHTSKGA